MFLWFTLPDTGLGKHPGSSRTKPSRLEILLRERQSPAFASKRATLAMVTLTDAQIAAITNATRPLQPSERTAFMAALFEELIARQDQIGDGSLARTLRDLQRRYFAYPTDEEAGMLGTRWHKLTARA